MSPRVVVLDHGSGDVRSAVPALARAGADVEVTADKRAALTADGLVVPDGDTFAAVMAGLLAAGGDQVVDRRLAGGRPVLGIGTGMHVMFDEAVVGGVRTDGLGEWPGAVEDLGADAGPHTGWAQVDAPAGSLLFAGLAVERFCFAHTSAARAFPLQDVPAAGEHPLPAPLVAWAEHGGRFVAAVENGPLTALQLHPEKSGDAGAQLLTRWVGSLR